MSHDNTTIILVTHENIGTALLTVLRNTLENIPLPIITINAASKSTPEELTAQLQNTLHQLSPQQNVLILTDLFGSTPCNVLRKLKTKHPLRIVTGLNMPMLIRTVNYADLPLDELAQKAQSGGKDGVVQCSIMEGATV